MRDVARGAKMSEKLFCQSCDELMDVPACALFCPMCGRPFRDETPLDMSKYQSDLQAICEALGLFAGSRPVSPSSVVQTDVIPAIRALRRGKVHEHIVSHLKSQAELIHQLLRAGIHSDARPK